MKFPITSNLRFSHQEGGQSTFARDDAPPVAQADISMSAATAIERPFMKGCDFSGEEMISRAPVCM
jgi:hypothetical protein